MHTTYPMFAEYHFYLKKWLECLLTLPRLQALNLEIPVVYSTPRRAFAMGSSELLSGDAGGEPLYAPPNQGNNWLPIMVFHSTSFAPVLGKTIPYEHILVKPIQDNNNEIIGYQKSKVPLVYELSYTGTLYGGLMQDVDILAFKIASEFKPMMNLWCGDPLYVGVDGKGLYAQVLLESVVDATDYEPMDIGERVVRKDFNWKILEAYVPTAESKIDGAIIDEIFTDIDFTVETS